MENRNLIRLFGTLKAKVSVSLQRKQGRKPPIDTPKRMIERRQREGEREKER